MWVRLTAYYLNKEARYEDAIADYNEWVNEPKPDNFDEMEVPNPIGYKMAEWAKAENGETVLVPYARRGMIAKYSPAMLVLPTSIEDSVKYRIPHTKMRMPHTHIGIIRRNNIRQYKMRAVFLPT